MNNYKRNQNKKFVITTLVVVSTMLMLVACFKSKEQTIEEQNRKIGESNIESVKKEYESKAQEEVKSIQTIKSGTYFDSRSQRATMEVTYDDGVYYFDINWGSSASENTNWKLSGIFNKALNAVAYHNEICFNEEYDSDGNCVKKEEVFKNGVGMMKFIDGKLYWEDEQEEKRYDDNYNAIFEMPPTQIDGFNNSENMINGNITSYNYATTQYYEGNVDHKNNFFLYGYDREAYRSYNGEAMATRLPVIAGNNYYMVRVANGLIPNAYRSIENWCNENLKGTNLQGYYLNYAVIDYYTNSKIVMTVNCALQKNGILDGHHEFMLELNLANNRFYWEKKDNYRETTKRRIYDADNIIIIE